MEVVSAAHGAFGPLLEKLTTLLIDEYARLKGVRREIRSLRSELSSMHAALKEYTKLEDPNDQVKTWISLVRELAYDIEDALDKFLHQLGNGNGRHHGGFKKFFRKTICHLKTLGSRRGIADQIDGLKDRIKQVKELKDSYTLDGAPSSTIRHGVVDPRLHAIFAEEAHLVGMEGQFHCHAFVSVSQKPNIKKIIKDVISQVPWPDGSAKDTMDWDEKKSIAKLREMLQDKRYLIIIDDVWSRQAWNTIKCAFPENNCSSRIIATTRIVDVAKSCCLNTDDRMYEMEALSDLHSRRLFLKRIFGSGNCCPEVLNKVSDEILKKCGGLPLAIISISSLLANRPAMKDEWEKVKRSIGCALENNQSLDGMSSILSLSYKDLPPNLKTCLLYLSVFPEDYIIERDRLVRRWMAEGFISEEHGQSQQEVAENYFYELVNKSMVQPVDIGYDGKVRACQVHDMMLEIIISKSIEENFITVIRGGQTSLKNHHGFIRRLSVQHIDQDLLSALANEDLSHVRSLTVTSSVCMKHFPSIAEFESLRVLDFEDCQDLQEYDMNNIDKLFQLKYLSFRGTCITKPPSRIVMLHNLETLDLRMTSMQRDLPDGIVLLTKLQYLLTEAQHKVPIGITNMRSLRVTPNFHITKSSLDAVEELGNLTRLNELSLYLSDGYRYKRHEEVLLSALCKLSSCKLRSLYVSRGWGSLNFIDSWSPPSSLQIFHMSSNMHLANIPKWISPGLTSLVNLDINVTELREEGLNTLGLLPSLLDLALCLRSGGRKKLTIIGFPCLKRFNLFSWDGAYVTLTKGSMRNLEEFLLSFDVSVAKAYGFYLGIEHLPSLKLIQVVLRNKGATYSESKAASAAIRKEAGAHPNHPEVCILEEPDEDEDEDDNEKTDNDEEKSSEEGN
uniref:NBS-LRR disease resistance protein n=1 Tax=Dasypyrum villosum TaxID=40247 RepID=A0A8K1IBB4_9POAL|nr:NBS-LRR disease resistance protein [Dasypyrum villosum]